MEIINQIQDSGEITARVDAPPYSGREVAVFQNNVLLFQLAGATKEVLIKEIPALIVAAYLQGKRQGKKEVRVALGLQN